MKLLKAQPHSPQLLKNANTRAINMLKHSARELPLAEKLRQKMPKPAFISGLSKYSHAVTYAAACITIVFLIKTGVFQTMDKWQSQGKQAVENYYTTSLDEDLLKEIL